MKKLYISADIEGVCGIADWKETEIGEAQGAYFREEMTKEVRAACEAACEAGVEEIFVKDAHGSGRSIDPSALPENVRLMRAWTRDPYSMMAGLDASFGGVMFIGYHSGAGSDGNPLAHTMDSTNVHILINGELASEFLINAYTAASFGVPILLLSGDRQLCEGVRRFDPSIRTVAVSEGLGNASISINPALARRRIKEEAAAALRRRARRPR
jgi:D-amino peptidase